MWQCFLLCLDSDGAKMVKKMMAMMMEKMTAMMMKDTTATMMERTIEKW